MSRLPHLCHLLTATWGRKTMVKMAPQLQLQYVGNVLIGDFCMRGLLVGQAVSRAKRPEKCISLIVITMFHKRGLAPKWLEAIAGTRCTWHVLSLQDAALFRRNDHVVVQSPNGGSIRSPSAHSRWVLLSGQEELLCSSIYPRETSLPSTQVTWRHYVVFRIIHYGRFHLTSQGEPFSTAEKFLRNLATCCSAATIYGSQSIGCIRQLKFSVQHTECENFAPRPVIASAADP